jgi:hypothetical protein
MKKLMMLGAMLALVLVAAAPAIAQEFGQEFSERRDTSGSASPKAAVSNTGDNANLCPTVQQVANTGQVLNEQGVTQFGGQGTTTAPQLALPSGFFVGSDGLVRDNNGFIVGNENDFLVVPTTTDGFFTPTTSGDIDFEGSTIDIEPTESSSCDQTINQSAAA